MSTPRKRLLILDDDAGVVDFLCESLDARGYEAVGRTSPEEALALFERESFDLVITDVEMPRMRGTEVLEALLTRKPGQLVVLITAFGSVELAVAAVKAGACDFVTKPFNIDALVLTLERAFRERQLRREIVRLRAAVPGDTPGGLVARSSAMQKALEVSRRAARSDATVLLTGETGTGKSALARFIHESSGRRTQPFLQLNCAALPSGLAESELFGARRGAYTDAREDRAGVFVSVGGGTLFLDEVGELSLEVQAKLLQALETGRVRPLGSSTETPVRARVLAATNQPLEVLLREGRFRADLYYRLNVIRIEVPPLRERREDIPPLVKHLLERINEKVHKRVTRVPGEVMERLTRLPWRGNVRELENVLTRAVVLAPGDVLRGDDLPALESPLPSPEPGRATSAHHTASAMFAAPAEDDASLIPTLEEAERQLIARAMTVTKGHKGRTCQILGISRPTLERKLQKYGLAQSQSPQVHTFPVKDAL